MSATILSFGTAEALVAAMRRVRAAGAVEVDALTPFRIAEVEALLPGRMPPVRAVMLAAGLCVAGLTLSVQWWSATENYPIVTGGRPLASWPAFGFATFEMGVLAAAVAGFVMLLAATGLPRLNHPLFEAATVARASDDRFLLVVSRADRRFAEVAPLLPTLGADAIEELA